MCRILGISRDAYYKWKNHGTSRNDILNELIAEKAETIHEVHPDMGYRRIRDTLAHDHGIHVNDRRILRICRKKKIQSYVKTDITAAQNQLPIRHMLLKTS
ncbi:MAG: transposase [Eubacterium sp.]|jgi:predicted nucleic acid-binding protein|nr:transposase [Eubacterium sp.]